MADVRLAIAGREYIVTCKDGEEERLHSLGRLVDAKAREAGGAGGLNESRQLLFASLLLADQLFDLAPKQGDVVEEAEDSHARDSMAETIEKLATRLESLVQTLEERN